jgi:cell division protein ZapA (FtsZ GTPase activity inhibitor)
VDIRFFGAAGRIYLAGTESEIQAAARKVVETLTNLKGREQ